MTKQFNEFDIITRHFAPLAKHSPGALNLADDAALIKPKKNNQIVVTTDTLVAGIHFREMEAPEAVANRLIGCNVSDLAAMGADPLAFVLAAAWPKNISENWISAFALSLGNASKVYNISLIGGDTVATPGPMSLTITALGTIPCGCALTRNGAKQGDLLFVSGTLGDGAFGLRALEGELSYLANTDRKFLIDRFQSPIPRLGLGIALRGIAGATVDISDGLIQDLTHVAQASRVSFEVDLNKIPVSNAVKRILSVSPDMEHYVLTGGDDYELAFTVPISRVPALYRSVAGLKLSVTEIGYVSAGVGDVNVRDNEGKKINGKDGGYQHVYLSDK